MDLLLRGIKSTLLHKYILFVLMAFFCSADQQNSSSLISSRVVLNLKSGFFTSITTSITTSTSQLRSPAGGGAAGDGGGGSNSKPTDKEIQDMAIELYSDWEWARSTFNLLSWYDSDGELEDSNDIITTAQISPDVMNILQKMSKTYFVHLGFCKMDGGRNPILKQLHFISKKTNKSHLKEKEASTVICSENGSPINLYLPEIRKKIPKVALRHGLQALLIHEIAHQHCADERVAKKIEHLFSSHIAQTSHAIEQTKETLNYLQRDLTQIQAAVDHSPVNKDKICIEIGEYIGTLTALNNLLDDREQAFNFLANSEIQKTLTKENSAGFTDMLVSSFDLKKFCFSDTSDESDEIEKKKSQDSLGNTHFLSEELERQQRYFNVLTGLYKKYLGIKIRDALNRNKF